jgi:hypothetical protein
MKKNKLSEAIDNLAVLYDNGALEVATDPAAFINRVSDNIKELRSRVNYLEELLDNDNSYG